MYPPLHLYIFLDDLEKVKECLKEGANPSDQDEYENTPLLLASWNERLDIIKFLVSKGANINHQNKCGASALTMASQRGYLDVVMYLISKGADINLRNGRGLSALDCAKFYIKTKVADYLRSLKGPLRLTYITLNVIDKTPISKEGLPEILFER